MDYSHEFTHTAVCNVVCLTFSFSPTFKVSPPVVTSVSFLFSILRGIPLDLDKNNKNKAPSHIEHEVKVDSLW